MPPARFERTTPGLGILCSILLSYGGMRKINYLQGRQRTPIIHVCTMWESYPIIFFGGLASTTALTSSSVGLLYRWKVANVLWPVMAMIRL